MGNWYSSPVCAACGGDWNFCCTASNPCYGRARARKVTVRGVEHDFDREGELCVYPTGGKFTPLTGCLCANWSDASRVIKTCVYSPEGLVKTVWLTRPRLLHLLRELELRDFRIHQDEKGGVPVSHRQNETLLVPTGSEDECTARLLKHILSNE